ncbi:anti-sigma factor family protein [Thalassobaculum sp.]|uniref:anti-sigma factor family protein n=1 Tax=Thalassobaculum sp. TaxID=2022740 RepID=UPI003B5B9A50
MPTLLDVITIEDLSAFVDGQADGDLAEAIEELDLQDDRCAETLGAFMAQNALMHRALDPMMDEPTPQRLVDLIRSHTRAAD